MKNRTCEICEEYARLRLRAGNEGVRIGTERPIGFICEDHGRFILIGPALKSRKDVDQLASDLKRHLGMTETPGRKATEKLTLDQIERQILKNEMWASQKDIADQLGVTPRVVRKAIRDGLDAPGATFKQFQSIVFADAYVAEQNSKKSTNKTHLIVSKMKKSRRMF